MTQLELENINKRILELKDLITLTLNDIKKNSNNKKYYQKLTIYTKEIKLLEKKLKKALKESNKNK